MTEEEDVVVAIDEETLNDGRVEAENLLIGKLLTDKSYSKKALKNVIRHLCNVQKGLEINELQDSMLKFCFGSKEEKKKVLDNEPWLFDKALLSLSDPTDASPDVPGQFTSARFWTQIHGLLLLATMKKMGEIIRSKVKTVLKVDTNRKGRIRDSFIRVRTLLDILKTLRRGMPVQLGSNAENIWCEIKFERQSIFCFHCGLIGHQWERCTAIDAQVEKPTEGFGYGVFLAGVSPNRIKAPTFRISADRLDGKRKSDESEKGSASSRSIPMDSPDLHQEGGGDQSPQCDPSDRLGAQSAPEKRWAKDYE